MKKTFLFFLFILTFGGSVFGQTFQSFTEQGDTLALADSVLVLEDMRSLYWKNPDVKPVVILGNAGLAAMPLSFSSTRSFLPQVGSGQGYEFYIPSRDELRYFNVTAPVSEMRYHSGYGRGQLFHAYFTQNITPYWNGFFQYRRINSEGRYFRQKVQSDNFRFTTAYYNPNSRYDLKFSFDWTKLVPEHNGGIRYDSVFTEDIETNRRLLDPTLNQTLFRRSRTQANLLHRYRLFGDSVGTEGIFIRHMASYNRVIQTLRSTDTILYDDPNYGERTQDSLFRGSLENNLWVDFGIGKRFRFDISAGLGNLMGTYQGPYWFFSDNTTYLLGEASISLGNWNLFGSLNQALFGTFDRSLKYSMGGNYSGKDLKVTLRYDIFQREQDLFDILYLSNSRIWYNNFSPEIGNLFVANMEFKGLRAGGEFSAIGDRVFYGPGGLPFQVNEVVDYTKVWASYDWQIVSHLNWKNQITLQTSSMKDTLLRMPDWVYETWLYTNWDLFKGNLQTQAGVEYRYYPEFTSYSFDPATANFILGQNANQVVGGFHYLNVFAGVQIGSAKVFLRIENVLEGIIPYNYFAAPGYPLPDRVFRLGVKWRFFN